MTAENLAAQAALFTCLAGLAVGRPDLPAAYVTISRFAPRELSVQLDSPSKVEAWREALGADSDLVRVDRIGNRSSLEFDASAFGIAFHVYATYEQAVAEAGTA
ncbi:hypothetical protein ACKI1Q_17970 [Streptomyces galilaeus]|uniref:hypothetical protein n=1 Tax=Streptomyces galilaeus TaxID=33899 RepID=UPI0038F7126F